MKQLPKLNVLYLEPDARTRRGLAEKLKAFFELCRLDADIAFAEGADEVIENALSGRVDIFVCDLSLNDSSPAGLGVIADVKWRCPWLFCIAVSRGEDVRMTEVDSRPRGYDLFIPKLALTGGEAALDSSPSYKKRFIDRFRYSPIKTFRMEGKPKEKERGISIARTELLPLLRQVVSYRLPIDPAAMAQEVRLTPLGGGRSASRVFVLQSFVSERLLPAQPCVLKIAERDSAFEEERRYDGYVRWALPQHARVDLMASGYTTEQGAIMYSFAYGRGHIKTLRDYLESGDESVAEAAMTRLFESIGSFWLEMPSSQEAASISERYLKRYYQGNVAWFNEDMAKVRDFVVRHHIPMIFKNHETEISGKSYPALSGLLQTGEGRLEDELEHEWALVHGDLNPGNIIISSTKEVALIDFRDAGVGHRYEDWVTLEGCIRMFWRWQDDGKSLADVFLDCLEQEQKISENDFSSLPDDGGWRLVAASRQHFLASAKGKLAISYYYGLAYYSFRLLRIEDMSDIVRARILATAYAAAKKYHSLADY